MKILGICGSPRRGSTTEQLVREVLAGAAGCETEFVSLAGKNIGPCRACLGCVNTNVCVLDDDLADLRQKIVAADGYVIGGANYFMSLNGLAQAFMERWYQFRHREGTAVSGKPAVAVGVGGLDPAPVVKSLQVFFEYNSLECVGAVTAQGPASCFVCGHGENCKVGGIYRLFGPGAKITEAITPSLAKQPESRAAARGLGAALAARLSGGRQAAPA